MWKILKLIIIVISLCIINSSKYLYTEYTSSNAYISMELTRHNKLKAYVLDITLESGAIHEFRNCKIWKTDTPHGYVIHIKEKRGRSATIWNTDIVSWKIRR